MRGCSRICCLIVSMSWMIGVAGEDAMQEFESELQMAYPIASNHIDEEIDHLLAQAEDTLFTGNFQQGLSNLGRVESLLSLTQDDGDYRKLRCVFAKTFLVMCEEGITESSRLQFQQFNELLDSKNQVLASPKEEAHETVAEVESSIVVDERVIQECIERIDSIKEKIETLCNIFPLTTSVRLVIQSVIRIIAESAKLCCTKNGFWKTCIQPAVDSWRSAQLFGIHLDPF